jgi:predicted nucleic acid-binding protein
MIHEEDDLILIGDLILLELLQGARDDAHAARIERDLRCFTIISMLNENLATEAARYYRRLRALGVTIRKTADMIIGTFCLMGGHSLLHDDRDFEPMASHLGLRVFFVISGVLNIDPVLTPTSPGLSAPRGG